MAAAAMVGPMGPCTLGKDKLKRPKKWADWHREAENKKRFSGITDSGRKWDFLRSCVGAELTELWDKEVRVVYKATGRRSESPWIWGYIRRPTASPGAEMFCCPFLPLNNVTIKFIIPEIISASQQTKSFCSPSGL